jgi:hypothetical protein
MKTDIKIWSEDLDPEYEHDPYDSVGEIQGAGYFSHADAGNSTFQGMFYLYRVYEREDYGDLYSYDFINEIVVPIELAANNDSSNVYIEYADGWCFNFAEKRDLALVSGRTLISFADADGDCDLLKLCELNEEIVDNASTILGGFMPWEINDFDKFEGAKLALVRINAKGVIGQNEQGIYDDRSTYTFSEYVIL